MSTIPASRPRAPLGLPGLPTLVSLGCGVSVCWLAFGLFLLGLDRVIHIPAAEAACRDALSFGFAGNALASAAIWFYTRRQPNGQRPAEWLYLTGAFYNALLGALLTAIFLTAFDFLPYNLPIVVALPLGLGALCAVAAASSAARPTAAEHEVHEQAAPGRAEIDASCRQVVVAWFVSAVVWLLFGSLLALLASIKLHSPYFLANSAWLTFGRVRPAHLNAMTYGWASMSGIGTLLWLQARLCRITLPFREALYLVAFYWNVALAYGLFRILAGDSSGVEWLELPMYSAMGLSLAFVVLFLTSAKMLLTRRAEHLYVSQWYLFGAVFWFPFLFIAANVLIFATPVGGSVKAVANWWFAHNVLGLWLTPIGLATAYYLIPKVLGRPIHSYYLSILGFWTVGLFYNWVGTHHLIGGPLPAWLISVGVVSSLMMFIPVVTVAVNHHLTMVGHFHRLRQSPTLRFTVFGAMSYTLVSLQGSLMALRTINQTTHFTHYTIAHAHLGVYAFFTMIMFGAYYYIFPRLTGREWWSAPLIAVHFWSTAIGMSIYFVALTYGGFMQGKQMNDPDVPFLRIVAQMVPYLQWRSVAGSLMTVGHVAFAFLVLQMVRGQGRPMPGPTLFTGHMPPLFAWRRRR